MAIGFSILFVGSLFALIYLYNVTKDRWNWSRIAKFIGHIVPLASASLFLLFVLTWLLGRNDNDLSDYLLLLVAVVIEIYLLHRLTSQRWNWGKIFKLGAYGLTLLTVVTLGYYAYGKAVTIYDEYQNDARIKKEELARECNAGEILRIEPHLKEAFTSVSAYTTIDEVNRIFKPLEPSSTEITIAEKNIKAKVAIAEIKPKCDSEFRYRVIATFNESGFLDDYRTIARNPPKGYLGSIDTSRFRPVPIDDLPIPLRPKGAYREMAVSEFSINFAEEAQAKQRQESNKKAKDTNPFSGFRLEDALEDPCAPSLSKTERLKRLAQFGKIRELVDGEYHAGTHMVKYFSASAGGGFWECR